MSTGIPGSANYIEFTAFCDHKQRGRASGGATPGLVLSARHAFLWTGGGNTGVNPAGDAGDTSPQYFGWGDVNIITYFRI